VLKNIKLEIIANFVCIEQVGITIMTIKVISSLDLQTIEKYIKNTNHINLDKVNTLCLLQSKLYLKIIDISYHLENTNTPISVDVIETIIKDNYIFNNIAVALKP